MSAFDPIPGAKHSLPEIIEIVEKVAEARMEKVESDEKNELLYMQCACNKRKLMDWPRFPRELITERGIRSIDNVCAECVRGFAALARIICVKCKLPVSFVSPHTDPSGFSFVAGRTYHVLGCAHPKCVPDILWAMPVEKILFDYQRSNSSVGFRDYLSQRKYARKPVTQPTVQPP